ncbi:MAG: NAD(P)-dependent oxidoreductase [Amaricoccus sp.]
MDDKPVVGFVGVGLMGWGMAKNAVEKGFPLRVIAHRKREAVDDLVARGGVEVASLAEMAAECDAVVLCVTGAPEVEAVVAALREAARPGFTIIDTSTSEPAVTARLAAEARARDHPLRRAAVADARAYLERRAPRPSSAARRSWSRRRPLLATWASAVIPVGGPVGSAHAIKLINNLVALGYAAIWSERYAMVKKVGIEASVFREVLSNSGMNCGNFQNFSKYAVEGDASAHKFTLANGMKDLVYYNRLANGHGAATLMSDGALQTLKLGVAMGMGERFMPEMVDIVLALNGDVDAG